MSINRALILTLAATACANPPGPELVERFRATCARLTAEASVSGTPIVAGSDGWYFAAREVSALAAEATGSAPRVASIAAEAERLGRDGVELLVVPVPPKGIVYPDRLAPELDMPIPVRRLDAPLASIYGHLRARGVRVIDLTEPFIRDRFHHEGPLYCRQDSHWSGVGCVVAAEVIAATARELEVLETPPTRLYGLAWFTTPIRGDLWQLLPQPPPREEIRARGVIAPDDPLLATVAEGSDARIAVVGDTHALVFHGGEPYHAHGAGIADQLAFEFRQPVALYADDRNTSPPGSWTLPALGAGTRIVIWIFAATLLLGDP